MTGVVVTVPTIVVALPLLVAVAIAWYWAARWMMEKIEPLIMKRIARRYVRRLDIPPEDVEAAIAESERRIAQLSAELDQAEADSRLREFVETLPSVFEQSQNLRRRHPR